MRRNGILMPPRMSILSRRRISNLKPRNKTSCHLTKKLNPRRTGRHLTEAARSSTQKARMSQSSWLVGGVLPGIGRQSRKKLEPSAERLLGLLHRWRDEAVRAGRKIMRIALAWLRSNYASAAKARERR
jgi:hypothetical protein